MTDKRVSLQRKPSYDVDMFPGKFANPTVIIIDYRKILNVSRLVLQLSLPNPMKLGVKSRMKM